VLIECPSASAYVVRHGPTNRRCVGATDGNAIATGHLLRETINPAQSSGQSAADRTSKQSCNALGEVIRSTDPAGNRIDTTYSTAGRVVLREVQTFGSGFDTAVQSIETSYDGMGRLSLLPAPSSSCLRVFVPIPPSPLLSLGPRCLGASVVLPRFLSPAPSVPPPCPRASVVTPPV
jgi:YD repeat-containing protein